MDAGRELDALVAEKVMGIETHKGVINDYESHVRGGPIRTPEFSTNTSDAWLVVEKLVESGWELSLFKAGLQYDLGLYHDQKVHVQADTVPLAICLAALKAVNEPAVANL